MTVPSTPTRRRVLATANMSKSLSDAPPSQRRPGFPATPPSARKAGIQLPAQASPQVRARLAELRRKAAENASSKININKDNNNNENNAVQNSDIEDSSENVNAQVSLEDHPQDSNETMDRTSSPRPSSSLSYASSNSTHLDNSQPARTPSPAASEITIELGMRTLQEEIEKSKTTGRLNLAARSIDDIPSTVLKKLLPPASIYHPSNMKGVNAKDDLSSHLSDLSLDKAEADGQLGTTESVNGTGSPSSEIKWWEAEDVKVIKASNNEFAKVPASLAGFNALQVLDLHRNKIESPFPASFGTLSNLTCLNIANNTLTEWPIELMALVHLRELDISYNRLSSLWSRDWKNDVRQRLKNISRESKRFARQTQDDADTSIDSLDSQSTAPDSSAGEDFWSAFPTPAVKTRAVAYMPTKCTVDYSSPLPSLSVLNLSGNRISAECFDSNEMTALPSGLHRLSLADNGIAGSLPLKLFGILPRLKALDVSRNKLDDYFFDMSGAMDDERLFQNLEELDLSGNALNSLEHLETCLAVPSRRTATYRGLQSASLQKAVATKTPDQASRLPELLVYLHDNPLRDEGARRKRMRHETRSKEESNYRSSDCSTSIENASIPASESVRTNLNALHSRLDAILARGQPDQAWLDKLSRSLRELNILAKDGETRHSPVDDHMRTPTRPPLQASRSKQSTTGAHSIPSPWASESIQDSGSSRARKLRLQEEARQWGPL